ncbi:MAG TPA: hypothetical protein VFR34_07125 [Paracoccaceae bacterium]|nr:hypothetical protein [Paracoccaceae bacterium]
MVRSTFPAFAAIVAGLLLAGCSTEPPAIAERCPAAGPVSQCVPAIQATRSEALPGPRQVAAAEPGATERPGGSYLQFDMGGIALGAALLFF